MCEPGLTSGGIFRRTRQTSRIDESHEVDLREPLRQEILRRLADASRLRSRLSGAGRDGSREQTRRWITDSPRRRMYSGTTRATSPRAEVRQDPTNGLEREFNDGSAAKTANHPPPPGQPRRTTPSNTSGPRGLQHLRRSTRRSPRLSNLRVLPRPPGDRHRRAEAPRRIIVISNFTPWTRRSFVTAFHAAGEL